MPNSILICSLLPTLSYAQSIESIIGRTTILWRTNQTSYDSRGHF